MVRTQENQSQGALFIDDPELLRDRRADKLGLLPVPTKPLRGKRRVSSEFANPNVEPTLLPNSVVIRLGKLLKGERPLADEITKYGAPNPDPKAIGAYVMGANGRNRLTGRTAEERAILFRQTQHVADKLQRELRTKVDTARIYRGALSSIRTSVEAQAELNPVAALYASAALEDFGICLRERPDVIARTGFTGDIAGTIEHMGVYAIEHPEYLGRQPDTLKLVQIEQAKREDFWGERLDVSTAMRDRSTAEDREAHEAVNLLIASFANPEV